jgi:hypothetical protein
MAAVLSGNNVEEDYLWSCTLSSDNKEYTWAPIDPSYEKDEEDDEEDPTVKPSHTLQRKSPLYIPFLGIARPQPQFQHSCVCERFI